MFKLTLYLDSTWFTDPEPIGRKRTLSDGLDYLAHYLGTMPPSGQCKALDGSVWCEYDGNIKS